ncbi:hypothetical protein B0H21DRAFT_73522 [Amylocystis lapponica]|nr:hypothetical protein B0H21DRAFT_73522 [Amylocystis lapponica]
MGDYDEYLAFIDWSPCSPEPVHSSWSSSGPVTPLDLFSPDLPPTVDQLSPRPLLPVAGPSRQVSPPYVPQYDYPAQLHPVPGPSSGIMAAGLQSSEDGNGGWGGGEFAVGLFPGLQSASVHETDLTQMQAFQWGAQPAFDGSWNAPPYYQDVAPEQVRLPGPGIFAVPSYTESTAHPSVTPGTPYEFPVNHNPPAAGPSRRKRTRRRVPSEPADAVEAIRTKRRRVVEAPRISEVAAGESASAVGGEVGVGPATAYAGIRWAEDVDRQAAQSGHTCLWGVCGHEAKTWAELREHIVAGHLGYGHSRTGRARSVKDHFQCGWTGCGVDIVLGSLTHHVQSIHLGMKGQCSRCGFKSRPDMLRRHMESCKGPKH